MATQSREATDSGTLFVVATPIGNRDDLSPRARQVLRDVDVVAAEDTRHTGRLLSHFGVETQLLALHEHNEEREASRLVERLRSGQSVALVSDAGTPLVSDPGYRLVALARDAGLDVSPIPGASAVTAALSVSGLPTDRFAFEGFLPAKAAARKARLKELCREPRTLVFLESVHKIRAMLGDLSGLFGAGRPAFIGRELTKLHEQCERATLGELVEHLDDGSIATRGEFVVIVAGAPDDGDTGRTLAADDLLRELVAVLPGREAVKVAARLCGANRNDLYERMLVLKGEQGGED